MKGENGERGEDRGSPENSRTNDGATPDGAIGTAIRPRRVLRIGFAPGSAPGGEPDTAAGPILLQLDPDGRLIVDGAPEEAALVDLAPPRALLEAGAEAGAAAGAETGLGTGLGTAPERHHVLVLDLPDLRRAALGIRRLEVVIDGWRFELDVESEARARLRERATSSGGGTAKGGPSQVRAIIPGRVVSVDVAEGDTVEAGGRLLVLEAMKMQNELKAPRAGTVARVAVAPGETVELGDVLVVIE
jgi:Biotin-requiring enzyme